MDYEETMVEEEFEDVEADDTLPDDIVEEDESEDEEDFPDEEDLEIPDEEEEEEVEEESEPPEQKPSEPGWIKQRISKAVEKAVRETEARMQSLFEQQMKPIREKMIEDEAQELVRTRKVADIETARELVRYRQNSPVSEQSKTEESTQMRNEQGQFASREQIAQEAATEARINELKKQAQKIKAKGGPDVIKEFTENEDIKTRVVSGELDFYEVAEMMGKPKRKPPTPTRSSNGASKVTPNAFAAMSDEQFDRFERQIDKGVRYKLK